MIKIHIFFLINHNTREKDFILIILKRDVNTLTHTDVWSAINKVLHDNKYNYKCFSTIFNSCYYNHLYNSIMECSDISDP